MMTEEVRYGEDAKEEVAEEDEDVTETRWRQDLLANRTIKTDSNNAINPVEAVSNKKDKQDCKDKWNKWKVW